MSEILHRMVPDLDIRSDGRTVHGIAVPFDQNAEVNDGFGAYTERFVRGAFERTIAQRGHKVKLLAQHDHQRLPLGRVTTLREDAAGLYVEARVSQTRVGDEVLELVRDRALDSFSVGFRGIRDRRTPEGVVERLEVALHEVSLVPFPAYAGAAIAGVRSAAPHISAAAAQRRLRLLELSP